MLIFRSIFCFSDIPAEPGVGVGEAGHHDQHDPLLQALRQPQRQSVHSGTG